MLQLKELFDPAVVFSLSYFERLKKKKAPWKGFHSLCAVKKEVIAVQLDSVKVPFERLKISRRISGTKRSYQCKVLLLLSLLAAKNSCL